MTLKELAKILNISVGTVSKSLRDSHEISQETKQKVKDLAKELNFHPNPNASSLRKQKSKTIAVVIPEIANNFFAKAIDGIEAIAQEKEYHVLIYLTHENYQKEVSILNHLSNGRVDGVIMSLSAETSDFNHIIQLNDRKVPIVFFDRIINEIYAAKVTTNDYHAGVMGTNHLIEMGCKKIAFLGFSKYSIASNNRKKGYIDTLKKNGIGIDESLVLDCSNDFNSNFSLINNILKKRKKVDAIFSSAENLALITYQICNERAIKIPRDLKLISFSNMQTASFLNPSLTTITQPAFEMGREAAITLFKTIEKPHVDYRDENKVLKSTLLIKHSSMNF